MEFSDLIGVPYKQGSHDPKEGLDCWGLCIEASKRAGISLPHFPTPGLFTFEKAMRAEMVTSFTPLKAPEPFCLVAFRLGSYFHSGVVMQDCRSFLHASLARRAVVMERLDHPFWKRAVKGFYKCKQN